MRLYHLLPAIGGLLLAAAPAVADEAHSLPLVYEDSFEDGADHWEPTDPAAWRVAEVDGKSVYHQFGQSDYEPPHRSPVNVSLLKEIRVSDFVLTATVKSTAERSGAHRNMCVIFGHRDPAHFYYVHLGHRPDPHSSQIMLVDDAPRRMITENESPGIPWDDWHQVKVVRCTTEGTIEVYFDDMENPVMVARDTTFTSGRIGLGSFDDHGYWTDLKLYGKRVEDPEE